jgi:hypothetical protein
MKVLNHKLDLIEKRENAKEANIYLVNRDLSDIYDPLQQLPYPLMLRSQKQRQIQI